MDRSALLLASLALTLAVAPLSAQDPATFFDENCAPCHTIGGGEQGGPDLKSVTQHRDRQWLIRFVMHPEAMVKTGDPVAVELVKHWDGAVMPATPDLTPQFAEAILTFIEQRSGGATRAAPVAEPIFTAADIAAGRALFTGASTPVNGAPACAACHAVAGEDGHASGGRLGVDLTQASVRLRGPRGLAAWLDAPPTPMMRAIVRRAPLTAEENRSLTAFLDNVRTRPIASAGRQIERLAGAGLGLAALGLAAVGFAWRGRFRAVRRPLVDRSAFPWTRGGDR